VLAQVDPVEHGKRRRVWDRAFTPGAIKSYEPMLRHRADLLLSQLAARAGAPLDLAEWLGFATRDFMGDFAYNGAFDTTAQGTDVLGFHALAMPALRVVEMVGTMPWLRPLVVRLPTKSNRFIEIAGEIVQRRKAEGGRFRDLFYYLVSARGTVPLHAC
jgi:cytochrome P450